MVSRLRQKRLPYQTRSWSYWAQQCSCYGHVTCARVSHRVGLADSQAGGILTTAFALPVMAKEFNVSPAEVQWVAASCMIVWVSHLSASHRGTLTNSASGVLSCHRRSALRYLWQEKRIAGWRLDLDYFQCSHHVHAGKCRVL